MPSAVKGLPADGWYSGDVRRMIANGTYADFRPELLARVENGFYGKFNDPDDVKVADSEKLLKKWDKEWESIPMEERQSRRAKTVEKTTPKQVQVKTTQGTKLVWKSEPSNDGEMERKPKKAPKSKVPAGVLTHENNPLLSPQPA